MIHCASKNNSKCHIEYDSGDESTWSCIVISTSTSDFAHSSSSEFVISQTQKPTGGLTDKIGIC